VEWLKQQGALKVHQDFTNGIEQPESGEQDDAAKEYDAEDQGTVISDFIFIDLGHGQPPQLQSIAKYGMLRLSLNKQMIGYSNKLSGKMMYVFSPVQKAMPME
jgi:hypothetical protein